MPRYAALLRGVSPINCKMPELKKALEAAGFTDIKTVLSSGNAVFTTRAASEASLQRKAETAIDKQLGREFMTIVRPIDALEALLASDPYGAFRLPPNGKRVVSFLRDEPNAKPVLPIDLRGARILALKGREIFTVYVPDANGPDFMTLIEKTFGKAVTTRTWDTVAKIVKAGRG
jgi:uncharacterized protein (DUF1697 family)